MTPWRRLLRAVLRISPRLAFFLARWPRLGRKNRQLAVWKSLVATRGPTGITGFVEVVGHEQLEQQVRVGHGAVLAVEANGPRSSASVLLASLAAEPLLVANAGEQLAHRFDVSIVVPGNAARTKALALKRAVDHARKGGVVIFGIEENKAAESVEVPRGFAAVARISDVAVFGVVTHFQSGALPARVTVTRAHTICTMPTVRVRADEELVANVIASIEELG